MRKSNSACRSSNGATPRCSLRQRANASRAVLAELDRAASDIQKNDVPAQGLIRISTQGHTAYHWFPPQLIRFQKKFPGVEVRLVIEATNNPFEALLDGKLDLALICDPIRNRRIRYTPLFEDDVVIVVPPNHPFVRKSCAAPEDFATENILLYPPRADSTLLRKVLEPAGIQPRKVQEVMLTEVILEMVIGGLGIAALPRWAAGPQLASGALMGVPLQPPGYRWQWSIAQLRANQPPAYVQEFIRLLADRPLHVGPHAGSHKAPQDFSGPRGLLRRCGLLRPVASPSQPRF